MPALPSDGQQAWGDILNAYISSLNTTVTNNATTVTNHVANSPADPHGDRAYAQALVSPLTTGVNKANGFVQLNSSGTVPAALITGNGGPGGMYTGIFDAVATYGAAPGTADSSAKIQAALNAAGSAGGGIVYVGPGTFSLANYLVIPNNTWLLMNQGCKLSRIPGSVNAPYLISNVQFGTSNTPSTQVRITGGTLDAVGAQNMTSACTPIFLIQAVGSVIDSVAINNVFNNPCIELNGCSFVVVSNTELEGVGSAVTQATVPAIRINSSSTSTTPTGLAVGFYNNAACSNVGIVSCADVTSAATHQPFGMLVGSDLFASPYTHKIISVALSSTNNAANNGTPVDYSHWTDWSLTGNIWFDTFAASAVDSWHSITLSNGWSNRSGHVPARYKLLPDNSVRIEIDANVGTRTDGIQIGTLPSGYFNTNYTVSLAGSTDNIGGSGTQEPHISIDTSGKIDAWGVTNSSATFLAVYASFPLD